MKTAATTGGWQEMNDQQRQRVAVVDLDNTIAEYDHWRGEHHFGEPIADAKHALEELHVWGWKIIIFTTRGDIHRVARYLLQHQIPFDSVNTYDHNPEGTSHKPIADVYFEDREAHCVGIRPYPWRRAMKRVRKLYQPPLCVEVDDAQAWADRGFQLVQWLAGKLKG